MAADDKIIKGNQGHVLNQLLSTLAPLLLRYGVGHGAEAERFRANLLHDGTQVN